MVILIFLYLETRRFLATSLKLLENERIHARHVPTKQKSKTERNKRIEEVMAPVNTQMENKVNHTQTTLKKKKFLPLYTATCLLF